MAIFIALITLALIVTIVNVLFIIVFRTFNKKQNADSLKTKISIIIAFKNEEHNLDNLFMGLKNLNYPQDNFEVILVDDNSTDNSNEKATRLSSGLTNYRVIKASNKKYPGKRGALDIGIANAKYPYLMITDADCTPASGVLNAYSHKFNSGFDMLFGLAPFKQSKELVNKVSCFENLRSGILTFTCAKMNLPYSAAARNFGFTASAYQKLGGFSKTLGTASGDDDLLIREAVRSKLKIGIVSEKDSLVFTKSKGTFKDYLNQKARHTKTSHHYLLEHKMILGSWHLFNILVLFSVLLFPVNLFFAIPVLVKLSSDILVIIKIQNMFHYKFKVHEIILHQAVYEIFLIINFLFSFRKNIIWKN